MRPIDQKTAAPEKILFVTHSSQEEGTHYTTQGHTGKHQGHSAGRGEREEDLAGASVGVPTGKSKPREEAGVNLNKFRGSGR